MKDEYKLISKVYDFILTPFLGDIRQTLLDDLLEYKEKKILDLCGGTGDQLKKLEKNGFTYLHCLDSSPSMLKVAQKGNHSIKIHHRDAAHTSFEDSSFDLVILSFAIHEKSRVTQTAILTETFRILKKNATLVIVDFVFDEKTSFIGKAAISTIEFLAGKEHYKNFQNYIRNNGLLSLIDEDKFVHITSKRKAFNSIIISTFRKQSNNTL